MQDRSAVDTIAGYFYQFDHSILSLLNLSNDLDVVSLECIEDVDISTATETTAVQCKYYAQTEYNHSVIKPAIMLMLTHFANIKSKGGSIVNYRLWGHFSSGQQKLVFPIDLDFLRKNFLSYTNNKVTCHHDSDLGVGDVDLAEFLSLLTINITANGLVHQFQEIKELLQRHFKCSAFQAEYFFYNNALRVIRELSISKNPANRTITRKDFLKRINTSGILFGEWFVALKGKKAHFAALRKEYFTSLNVSPFERYFLVEVEPVGYERQNLKDVLFRISKKYSRTKKVEPDPFCPYVYVHGIDENELIALKKELIAENFLIVDGHDFRGADFSPVSIQKQANYINGVRLKILNSLADLEVAVSMNNKTRKIYQFHLGQPYCNYSNESVAHTRIQFEKLSDITQII